MTVSIEVVDRTMLRLMVEDTGLMTKDELKALDACLCISHDVYVGLVDGEFACCWGLVPPSMMSDKAYLWLYTTPLVDEHKFLFIRHSQLWMEEILTQYDYITGHCKPDNKRAIRWIEWLGGHFTRPFGERAVFQIRRRHGRSVHASRG